MGAIVVDTSAIVAIALGEPLAEQCAAAAGAADEILMSAATLGECMTVGLSKGEGAVDTVIAAFNPTIVPVTEQECERMLAAYRRWGKGIHRAKLNIFDCFAYALAVERDLPLLFIGDDFAQTDVRSAL